VLQEVVVVCLVVGGGCLAAIHTSKLLTNEFQQNKAKHQPCICDGVLISKKIKTTQVKTGPCWFACAVVTFFVMRDMVWRMQGAGVCRFVCVELI